jgi:hypothetical protein
MNNSDVRFTRVVIIAWVAISLLGLFGHRSATAQSTTDVDKEWERLRLLFVPEAELPAVLDGPNERVVLEQAEVTELLTKLRQKRTEADGQAPHDFRLHGPHAFIWERASYEVELDGDVGRLNGHALGQAYGNGLISLPLPFKQGLIHRLVQNGDAPVWHRMEDGQLAMLLSEDGKHQFQVEMTIPVSSDSVRQSVHLHLPNVAVATMNVRVAGNVDLVSGAAVIERRYDEAQHASFFQLAAGSGSCDLVFTLNNRQKQQKLVWDSRSLILADVSRTLDRVQIIVDNQVLQGQLTQAEWRLANDWEISQVTSDGVRQWQVVRDDQGPRLQVWFHAGTPTRSFHVAAFRQRIAAAEMSWESPKWEATTAYRQPRVIEITTTEDLLVPQIEVTRMDLVPAPIADNLRQPYRTNADAQLVRHGSWYGTGADSQARLSLRLADDRFTTTASHYLLLSSVGVESRSVFRIENQGELRFDVKLDLPPGHRVQAVSDAAGPLEFQTVSNDSGVAVQVALRTGVGGTVQSLLNESAENSVQTSSVVELILQSEWVPDHWFANWSSKNVTVRPPMVTGAQQISGILAVGVAPTYSLKAIDAGTMIGLGRQELVEANLASLEPNVAFDMGATTGELKLELERRVATTIAQSVSFYQLEPTRILVRGEWIIDVRNGTQEMFRLQLPRNASESAVIQALTPIEIRQQSLIPGQMGLREVQLTQGAEGRVHFFVDYEVPVANEEKVSLQFEPLRLVDAAWQTQLISIESNPRLEALIDTALTKWSVDQLPDTRYQPGRRLLGIWDATNDQLMAIPATISQQQINALPTAVIQSRELFSKMSSTGTLVMGAKFQLKSTTGNLWLQLPEGAELWSLSQNGWPQTVQVTDGRIMISFADRTGQQAHDVQLVYLQSSGYDATLKQLNLTPPQWFFDVQAKSSDEVPVVKTEWHLEPPPGLQLKWRPADWSVGDQDSLTWFERHGHWLKRQGTMVLGTLANVLRPLSGFDLMGGNLPTKSADMSFGNKSDVQATISEMMPMMSESKTSGFAGSADQSSDPDPFGALEESVNCPAAQRPTGPGEESQNAQQQMAFPIQTQQFGGFQGDQNGQVAGILPPSPTKPSLNMKGFRSLQIAADGDARQLRFVGLGNKDRLSLQLVDQSWLDLLTWVIGCFVFAAGLLFGRKSLGAWFGWAAFVLFLSAAAQWLWDSLPEVAMICERMIWVVALLVLWKILGGFVRHLFHAGVSIAGGFLGFFSRLGTVSSAAGWLLIVFGTASAAGQTFLDDRPGVQALSVPDDAIVIPYDPALPENRFQGRWLVPKAWFDEVREWELATPASKIVFPHQLFLPGGNVQITAVNGEVLEVLSRFQLQLPAEQVTYIPLQFGGGVLLAATVDGDVATVVDRDTGAGLPPALNTGEKWLMVQGSGSKVLELRLHFALNRVPGGWQVEGMLPASVATSVVFSELPPDSRLTWSAGGTSRIWTVPADGVVSPLGVGPDGQFSVRWRAAENQVRIGSAAIHHEAEIAVREAGVQVASRFKVQSVEPTDELVLEVPDQWRVERIEGENLRAWNTVEGPSRQILLQFLNSGTNQNFQVVLVGEKTYWNPEPEDIQVPFAKVKADGTLSGSVKIFRSSALQVAATDMTALRRSNLIESSSSFVPWLSWQVDFFGLRPYQAFTWESGEPKLVLSVARKVVGSQVTHRNILHFDVARTTFETQITFDPSATPYRQVVLQIPTSLKAQSLTCLSRKGESLSAVAFQVAKRASRVASMEEYELRLADFQTDELLVTLQGTLSSTLDQALSWEPIRVVDAVSQKYEYAVTRTETVELMVSSLSGAEQVLPDEFKAWLDPKRIASLPVSIRARDAEHQFEISRRRLPPLVSFESVTDLTVGDRVVEETLLLEWKIERSGINQVEFLLPKSWRDCQIEGPWIGRIEREPADNDMVRFVIFLQDRIVGDYRLIATLDRSIQQSDRFATIPQNMTGETRSRWITAQNSGNLELELLPRQEVTQIQRQRSIFTDLQKKINATYLANAFSVESNAVSPQLEWRSVPRSVVETRSARVRLSETDLVVDREGRFNAKQRLQVSNRTQPKLQLQLPAESRLIQLLVDGQPVQPLANAGGAADTVQIPLLKSSELNLDYPIDVIYQGRLNSVTLLQEVSMPLAFTVDVESEVSHLRLHLSSDLRPLRFGGTMSQVIEERVLREEVLDYRVQQLSNFKKSISKDNLSNAQQARQRNELELFLSNNDLSERTNPSSLAAEIDELNKVLSEDHSQIEEVFGNRANIRGLVAQQRNSNETNWNKDYSFNFSNPLGESQQQIELGDLEQRNSGQPSDKAKDSRNATNSLLSKTYQSDEGLQSRSGRKGAEQTESQAPSLPAEGFQTPRDFGGQNMPPPQMRGEPQVASLEPGRSNGMQGQQAATQPPLLDTPPTRLSSGLLVDFVPTGNVYYFRVPRGKPELTVSWTNQEIESRFISMWQLLGGAVGCFALMMLFKVIRPRLNAERV